jgi:hypothetical protein
VILRVFRAFLSWFLGKRNASKKRLQPRPNSLTLEGLEKRDLFSVDSFAQFVIQQANSYAVSPDRPDNGLPVVFLYRDFNNDSVYGQVNNSGNATLNGNDPNAGFGRSSFTMTWNGSGTNAFFQFGIGPDVGNRPRNIPNFGSALAIRFLAAGDVSGRQMQVNVFQTVGSGSSSSPVASQWFTLQAGFLDYVMILPAGLGPQNLYSVQFLMDQAHGMTTGARVSVDEVRINTQGFDPLRLVQSYVPGNTTLDRDISVYPNFSSLYDNALAIKVLYATGDTGAQQLALSMTDALLATGGNGSNGYFSQLTAGHALLGAGVPRPPRSQIRSLGDNSWFGLALLDMYRLNGNPQYLLYARQISDWAEANLKAPGTLKGYLGGYDASGAVVPWRSTEHNIDFFALNNQLAIILASANDPSAATYAARAQYAGDFVIAMFDSVQGKFWTGTTTGDTINTTSVPLDTQTWSYLAMSQSTQYHSAIDWNRPIAWAVSHLTQTDGSLTGFTFSTASTPNDVWLEGVAQGAVVFDVAHNPTLYAQSLQTLATARGPIGGVPAASSDGLQDPNLGVLYDHRQAVAPTAWTWFAVHNINPLVPLNIQTSFVTALYHDILQRPPDPAGLAAGVHALQAGVSRAALAAVLWDSAEHRGLQVDADYARYLHRAPDPNGFSAGVNYLVSGGSEVTLQQVLLTSTEYTNAHATDKAFVDGLYADVLARAPDPASEAAWIQALGNGVTRAAAAQAFLTSTENDRNIVDGFFIAFLHRAADPAGEASWVAVLQADGGDTTPVASGLLGSDEYYALHSSNI